MRDIVKTAGAAAATRQIAPDAVATWRQRIEEKAEDINKILEEERMEKEIRVAEMEVHKAQNVMEERSSPPPTPHAPPAPPDARPAAGLEYAPARRMALGCLGTAHTSSSCSSSCVAQEGAAACSSRPRHEPCSHAREGNRRAAQEDMVPI